MQTIFITKIATPIGEMTAGVSDSGVHLLLYSYTGQISSQKKILQKYSEVTFRESSHKNHDWLTAELEGYFFGKRRSFSLPVHPKGTEFQQTVWHRLQNIPFGSTESYQELTNALGDPMAIRAVAAANGKNPVAILIPCHRVIGKNGSLTGYTGGLEKKRALLNHERTMTREKMYRAGDQIELI